LRVVITDDQTLFRAGLAGLLRDDPRVDVVGEAADGAEAVALVDRVRPDVVLMDLRMPTLDGTEATRRITQAHPKVKVLVLSALESDATVVHALRNGAAGYVLKSATPEAIVSSMLSVMAGDHVMTSTVAARMLQMIDGGSGAREEVDGLTARQVEILKLMASGMANKQIAYKLHIGEKTVRNHVSNLYEKLGIADRAQAALYAVRKGLVEV
jgi:DNA-binding NarL/FixJ family response regulator